MLVKKLEVSCGKWNLIVVNSGKIEKSKNRKVEKSKSRKVDLGISELCSGKCGSIKVTDREKVVLSSNVL